MKDKRLKALATLVGRILAKRWHDHLQDEKKAATGIKSSEKSQPPKAQADAHPLQQNTS
jgi:hypothetical protein